MNTRGRSIWPVVFYGGLLIVLFGEITRYGVRIHESFIAMFLLEIYFVVLLGRTGSSREDVQSRRVASVAS